MYIAWHTAANDVYSHTDICWAHSITLGIQSSCSHFVGPKQKEARKQLRGFSVGMNWLALNSIKPHHHPCILESGCQGKERHPTAPGISKIKKKLNKATQDFLSFCRETATHKGLNCEHSLQLRKRVEWQQLGSTSKHWTSICLLVEGWKTLKCGLQEQTGTSAWSAGELQADRNLLLKQRQMQCPVLRMKKSISTGWGANSCWAVMQNHRRFGVGRDQPPLMVPTPHLSPDQAVQRLSLVLNTARNGESKPFWATSSSAPPPLEEKNFVLTSNLNPLSFSSRPSPHPCPSPALL